MTSDGYDPFSGNLNARVQHKSYAIRPLEHVHRVIAIRTDDSKPVQTGSRETIDRGLTEDNGGYQSEEEWVGIHRVLRDRKP